MSQKKLPVGVPAAEGSYKRTPARREYRGRFVRLAPIDAQNDAEELYACSHGSEERDAIWTYLGYGPFQDAGAMGEWLSGIQESADPLFLTVHHLESGRRGGIVSFLNIVAEMRRLEIGHIWYGPEVHRTKVNTECAYLLLCEAFDRLDYRRAEWKCDSLNARSRAAAQRLGFTFEGIFRQHMVVKGRNRDTAWFSMLDTEWEGIKRNAERWLYEEVPPGVSLRELNAG